MDLKYRSMTSGIKAISRERDRETFVVHTQCSRKCVRSRSSASLVKAHTLLGIAQRRENFWQCNTRRRSQKREVRLRHRSFQLHEDSRTAPINLRVQVRHSWKSRLITQNSVFGWHGRVKHVYVEPSGEGLGLRVEPIGYRFKAVKARKLFKKS